MMNMCICYSLLLATLGLQPASAPAVAVREENVLAITHAVIVDGNGGAPIEDGTVIIRGKRIEAVGPSQTLPAPSGAKVVDARGKTAMPGLADMHVHLVGGWDGETTDLLGYQRYLNSLLYAGVTTVLDTGNIQAHVLQLRQEVAAGRLKGPRIYCAGALIEGPDPLWPDLSYTVSSAEQIPKLVQRQKNAKVDVIKVYAGLSDRIIYALAQEARKQGLKIFIDQGPRNGSTDLMNEGIAAFAHLPTRKMSNEALQLMKEKGIRCISTLTVYEAFARRRLGNLAFVDEPLFKDTSPPWFLEELKKEAGRVLTTEDTARAKRSSEGLKEAQRNARLMVDQGILLAAGTDAPYPGVTQGEGIHRELELLVEAGLTPLEAITSATKNAATLVDADREWGTLEPGKLANILLVNGRPDRNIGETRHVAMVIREGKLIDRELLKFDVRTDPGFRTSAPVSVNP